MNDLDGITVVSLEQAVAAPYVSGRLAEAGARVIKIEREEGDFARYFDDYAMGESAYFAWLNAGKESAALNLKLTDDADLLRNILTGADVFIQNLAPGALGRLGFDPEDLREQYPSLIICSISGYGESGPYRNQKAYDLLIQAEAGLCSVTGVDGDLTRVGVSISDIATGMTAYQAILEALFARERDPDRQGRLVSVSLFHTTADLMNVPYLQHKYGGFTPKNMGLRHPSVAPYGAFDCKDGKAVLICIQNEREWQSLCDVVMSTPELAGHKNFATNMLRVENRDELESIISARFAEFSREEMIELLEEAKIAYGRVSDLDDLIAHPQNRFRRIETNSGTLELLGRGAETEGKVNDILKLPDLGRDNEKIREEFGK